CSASADTSLVCMALFLPAAGDPAFLFLRFRTQKRFTPLLEMLSLFVLAAFPDAKAFHAFAGNASSVCRAAPGFLRAAAAHSGPAGPTCGRSAWPSASCAPR